MSENEHEDARQWFAKADTDFTSARMFADRSGPAETICFLAQQGAEKYLKGYLVWQAMPFRKVHDLLEILNACRAIDETFGELETDCRILNPYAVRIRYPGYASDYTDEDARDALSRAEHIRRFVREQLGLEKPRIETQSPMSTLLGLKCILCGAEYSPDQVRYVCPKHGDEGILDVVYDYVAIGQRLDRNRLAHRPVPSLWRYAELLPLEQALGDRPGFASPYALSSPLWDAGGTPLYHAHRLGDALGLRNLYLKDDGRNPTASFKDRASAVVVVKALELGAQVVTTASSGNAAAALAGMAASVGMPVVIFVPETAPQAKVAQLLMFGATVLLVKGTYDQAFDLTLAASKEFGWYCRNTAYNPYTREGKKTASYEICEQLGWHAPDRIFVAVGDGNIISGLHKGLKDLLALGWIDRVPKLMGVQAAGSAVLVDAWQKPGETFTFVVPDTLADSISVGIPRDRFMALRAVRETGGEYIAVTDDEILDAMRILAREAAIFAEPAGATGFAGLQKMVRENRLDPAERIVVVVTGNGLKDVASAIRATGEAYRVEPAVEDVRRVLENKEQL